MLSTPVGCPRGYENRPPVSPARWLSTLVALLGLAAPARAEHDSPLTQHQVEAAFLYHFCKYVTWPPRAFSAATDPIVIGVLGENPFGSELADTVAREKPVQGRPLRVVPGRSVTDVARCHILFIGPSEQPRLGAHLAALQRAGSPALTVGETEDFLRAGGMVRFVVEKNKVRFEIHAAAAERAGLTISSKLLSLARNTRDRS